MVNVDIVTMLVDNESLAMQPGANVTYEYGPPRTICGIPIPLFSYIFLIIGAAAPIVFVISFLVVNKCYKLRKSRHHKTYSASLRQIDEFEKFEQFSKSDQSKRSSSAKNSFSNDIYFHYGTESSKSSFVLLSMKSSESPGIISSDSNPNVYFKKPTVTEDKPKRKAFVGHSERDSGICIMGSKDSLNAEPNSKSSPNLSVGSDGVESERSVIKSRVRMNRSRSTNSEEAHVLACFDEIYQQFDSVESSSNELLTPLSDVSEHGAYNNQMETATRSHSLSEQTHADGLHGNDNNGNRVNTREQLGAFSNEAFIRDDSHAQTITNYASQTAHDMTRNCNIQIGEIINGNSIENGEFNNPAYSPD